VNELLESLRRFDALRDKPGEGQGDDLLTRTLPCQEPVWASASDMQRLPALMSKVLSGLGFSSLYAHQVEAIDAIRSGADVVLESPTASGKTLSFALPLALALGEDPQAHALIIHPMKALSHDQRRQWEQIAAVCNGSLRRPLDSWIYDGDTEQEDRALLRTNPPAVLFTNPEMLHASFLGWREQWERFLRGLKMIVLDEIHEYRGYFGTNVALLLRRSLALMEQYGVRPQLVLATATCGNAREHAERLTGRPCTLVRAGATARPQRHFAFIRPGIPDYRYYDIYRLRIVRAVLACMSRGLNTLIFCPWRRFVEEAAIRAKQEAPQFGLDPERIAPYRSGYDAALRRQIEEGLRTGRYQAVFSTNALEIGIDIGRLDACILAGFPDSPFSAWQRIGRVGRRWDKPAYILFYAMNNPFDRFMASNIDAFLDKPLDEILIGVDNQELMEKHLPYLVHESGGVPPPELKPHLGERFYEFACKKMADRRPVQHRKPHYLRLSLRGGSGVQYRLMHRGQELGTISDAHRFREAYIGAIYHHFGKAYRVLNHGADEIELEEAEPHLHTEGKFYTVMQDREILRAVRYAENLAAYYGRVTVFENFTGYKVIDTRSGEVIDEQDGQAARPCTVRAFWLEVADPSRCASGLDTTGLLGVEQLLRIGAPFVIPCDRHDLGTWTKTAPLPVVYLHETVAGGIGVAEKALQTWPTILQMGIDIAQRCPCRQGCPRCLQPPHWPVDADGPNKQRAIQLAQAFIELASSAPRERYDPDTHCWASWPRA
jgi:DEAD/DEAH box helicase domain-containing protein